ncbi:MAG: hypothetical protein ACRDQ5_19190 [Sciscionella sp.]
MTPHLGGVTEQSYQAIAADFAANVENLRHGRELHNLAPPH